MKQDPTKQFASMESLREFTKVDHAAGARISHKARKRLDRAKKNGGDSYPILRRLGF